MPCKDKVDLLAAARKKAKKFKGFNFMQSEKDLMLGCNECDMRLSCEKFSEEGSGCDDCMAKGKPCKEHK